MSLGALFGGLSPSWWRDCFPTAALASWICMLCQKTSPKRWFANV